MDGIERRKPTRSFWSGYSFKTTEINTPNPEISIHCLLLWMQLCLLAKVACSFRTSYIYQRTYITKSTVPLRGGFCWIDPNLIPGYRKSFSRKQTPRWVISFVHNLCPSTWLHWCSCSRPSLSCQICVLWCWWGFIMAPAGGPYTLRRPEGLSKGFSRAPLEAVRWRE